jgi:chitodextrinase
VYFIQPGFSHVAGRTSDAGCADDQRIAPSAGARPWNSSTACTAGDTVTEAGNTCQPNWWTQGNDPATLNGATGSGQPMLSAS